METGEDDVWVGNCREVSVGSQQVSNNVKSGNLKNKEYSLIAFYDLI